MLFHYFVERLSSWISTSLLQINSENLAAIFYFFWTTEGMRQCLHLFFKLNSGPFLLFHLKSCIYSIKSCHLTCFYFNLSSVTVKNVLHCIISLLILQVLPVPVFLNDLSFMGDCFLYNLESGVEWVIAYSSMYTINQKNSAFTWEKKKP